MKSLRLILLVLGILGTASAVRTAEVETSTDSGGVKNPPESLRLEYKFDVGEIRRYDITITGEGVVRLPGQKEQAKLETTSSLTYLQHVTAYIPEEEVWRIEWNMVRGVMTIPEFGDVSLTIPPLKLETDKYGAVRSIEGLEELDVAAGVPQQKALGDILAQLRFPGFPQKEVGVDDIWEHEYAIRLPNRPPMKIRTVSELVGFERVNGADCAKIHTTYEVPFSLELAESTSDDSAKGEPSSLTGMEKGDIWTYFAYDEGKVIRTSATIELAADIGSAEEAPDEKTPQSGASESRPSEGEAPAEKTKHDLSVKYRMLSQFNREKSEPGKEKDE